MATAKEREQYCAIFRLLGTITRSINCSLSYDENSSLMKADHQLKATERNLFLYFYTLVTPIVWTIGLIGNTLCIVVFMRRRMLKQAASYYLAALAFSDQLVLVFYVMPEWFKWGLSDVMENQNLRWLGYNGVCHIFLYLSYTFRFQAVWMMVAATVERYLAVFHPMLRSQFRSRDWASRLILVIVSISGMLSLWKPATSRVVNNLNSNLRPICTSLDNNHVLVADTIYAASISILPAGILLVFNLLISRRLFVWRRRQECQACLTCPQGNRLMGAQFAVVLLCVSSASLLLTWPYYICWILQWRKVIHQITTPHESLIDIQTNDLSNVMHITRVLFYLNYSVNFFLYNLTGRFFRSELRRIIWSSRDPSHYSNGFEMAPTNTPNSRSINHVCRLQNN